MRVHHFCPYFPQWFCNSAWTFGCWFENYDPGPEMSHSLICTWRKGRRAWLPSLLTCHHLSFRLDDRSYESWVEMGQQFCRVFRSGIGFFLCLATIFVAERWDRFRNSENPWCCSSGGAAWLMDVDATAVRFWRHTCFCSTNGRSLWERWPSYYSFINEQN